MKPSIKQIQNTNDVEEKTKNEILASLENKNVRNLAFLLLVLIIIVAGLLGYIVIQDTGSASVTNETVIRRTEKDGSVTEASERTVYEIIMDTEEQIKQMKENLEKLDKPELIDSLQGMILFKEEYLHFAEALLKDFERFDSMSGKQQDEFLDRVVQFLDMKNQHGDIDFGLASEEMVSFQRLEKIGALEKDILALEQQRLALESDKHNLSLELARYKGLYAAQQEQLATLKEAITTLREDSLNNVQAIALLENMNSSLESTNAQLRDKINSVSPIRVDAIVFKPKDAKTRKDGSYKLGNVRNGFELRFELNANLETGKRSEQVRVVIKAPGIDSLELVKNGYFGQPVRETITLNDFQKQAPNFEFTTGLYSAYFYEIGAPDEETLERKFIYLRRWIDPEQQ